MESTLGAGGDHTQSLSVRVRTLLAANARRARAAGDESQVAFAKPAGVPLRTYKRLELDGRATLLTFVPGAPRTRADTVPDAHLPGSAATATPDGRDQAHAGSSDAVARTRSAVGRASQVVQRGRLRRHLPGVGHLTRRHAPRRSDSLLKRWPGGTNRRASLEPDNRDMFLSSTGVKSWRSPTSSVLMTRRACCETATRSRGALTPTSGLPEATSPGHSPEWRKNRLQTNPQRRSGHGVRLNLVTCQIPQSAPASVHARGICRWPHGVNASPCAGQGARRQMNAVNADA